MPSSTYVWRVDEAEHSSNAHKFLPRKDKSLTLQEREINTDTIYNLCTGLRRDPQHLARIHTPCISSTSGGCSPTNWSMASAHMYVNRWCPFPVHAREGLIGLMHNGVLWTSNLVLLFCSCPGSRQRGGIIGLTHPNGFLWSGHKCCCYISIQHMQKTATCRAQLQLKPWAAYADMFFQVSQKL